MMKVKNTGAAKPMPAGNRVSKAAPSSVQGTMADKIAKPKIKTNANDKKRK